MNLLDRKVLLVGVENINKMTSIVPFKFDNVQLFSVTIDDKVWTRAHEVSDALDYKKGRTRDALKKHVSIENKLHRYELEGRFKSAHPFEWPKNSQPDEYYINEEGMYELLFKSQQLKAKKFRRYCCNEMFPKIRNQLLYQRIEEKDSQLALLNDDLTESQDLVKQLEYNNTGLQGEIRAKNQEIERQDQQTTELQNEVARLRERYVDHCRDPGKDNVIMIVRKHTTKENDKRFDYPYYISRIQRRWIPTKRRWLLDQFPDSEEIVVIDNPNSVHAFNRFEEEEHVERYGCHFKLVDLTREDLYDMGVPAIEE